MLSPSYEIERATALAVLKDLSKNMRPSLDMHGNKILTIHRDDFEAVRKKYLDNHTVKIDFSVTIDQLRDAITEEQRKRDMLRQLGRERNIL